MIGDIFRTILTYPILNLMVVLYHILFSNLGLAIIAIAIISRLALIPLTKTQTEMTRKMATLKPELDKLKEKYKNNPEKLTKEQTKLYKKVGYNPLGCLGTFIPQIIILSVLIGVVRALTSNNTEGIYDFVLNWVSNGTGDFTINPNFLGLDLTQSYNGFFGPEQDPEIKRFSAQVLPYLGLSLIVGVVQFVTTKLTTVLQNPDAVKSKKKKGKKDEANMEDMQESMQKSMMFMFPLMTIFITISAPAALGIYWITQSLMLIAQYFILDFNRSKKGIQNLLTQMKSKYGKK